MAVRPVAALVYTHRWLGILFSLLFFVWFVSGIAMMYARMPRLSAEERLQRAALLDLRGARVAPAAIAADLSPTPERLRVGMLGERPVFRFLSGGRWTTVFADTGERVEEMTAQQALAVARQFAPSHARTMEAAGRIVEPDQWTLQVRGLLPAQQIRFGDGLDTHLYVSEQSGEPILTTTRRGRWLGYASAVLHWMYFTPLRRNGALWVELIIWTSIAGVLLCVTGLAWGAWRFSARSIYRLRGIPYTHSPYAGMMKWHHYAGLFFGLVTLTWVFSGLLSMEPWDWVPGTAPSPAQRDALSGGPLRWEALTLERLTAAAATLQSVVQVKEIELLQFRGELVAEAFDAPPAATVVRAALGDPGAVVAPRIALPHAMVRVAAPERGVFTAFDRGELEDAVRAAMPGVAVDDAVWLTGYDSYYYGRSGCAAEPCLAPPLPVLRVKFRDEAATWLYADPTRGAIARKEERLTRLNRWLYHGLHSLDFPWLYYRRPLWDIVVIALSLGGCLVSVTSSPAALRRLRRHVRRFRATMRHG
jgi:hypothetical protein